jgi:hypothetical protein
MKPWTKGLLLALTVLVVALLAVWWQQRAVPLSGTLPDPQQAQAPAPADSASAASAASAPAAPVVQFPIDDVQAAAPAGAASLPTAADQDAVLQRELIDLAGRSGVLALLQLDGFVRRVVATIDNLERPHAPASVWPVNPTAGRFKATAGGGQQFVDADNFLRYAPLVQFVEAIDTTRAVALYRWLYPLFQQSYEELGYPKAYFNDRLVHVIDHLLQAPTPPEPLAVILTEIKGPIPSTRPWVHYAFADPALERLSAGQKLLMRTGTVNERRLKAKLAAFRDQLVARPTGK